MSLKQMVLKATQKARLSALVRRATAGRLRILGYHGLWITPGYQYGECTFISPEQFDSRMARLKRSGLPVLPLGEAVNRLSEGTLPEAAVAITIDDGWTSTFTHMLPILERYELPATLYATTWYSGCDLPVVNVAVDYMRQASGRLDLDAEAAAAEIDGLPLRDRLDALRQLGRGLGVDEAWLELRQFHNMSAAELKEAHRRGLDIQLHTHRHINVTKEVDRLPAELMENRQFLAAVLGETPLTHFCYPSGTFHPGAPALLAASGICSATLVESGLNAPGTDPYRLRRLLDGRRLTDAEFDAYLSGVLHAAQTVRSLVTAPWRRNSPHRPHDRRPGYNELAAAE